MHQPLPTSLLLVWEDGCLLTKFRGKWEKERERALVRVMARGWNEIENNQGRGEEEEGREQRGVPINQKLLWPVFLCTARVLSGHGVYVCVSQPLSHIFHVPQSSRCPSTQEVSANHSSLFPLAAHQQRPTSSPLARSASPLSLTYSGLCCCQSCCLL